MRDEHDHFFVVPVEDVGEDDFHAIHHCDDVLLPLVTQLQIGLVREREAAAVRVRQRSRLVDPTIRVMLVMRLYVEHECVVAVELAQTFVEFASVRVGILDRLRRVRVFALVYGDRSANFNRGVELDALALVVRDSNRTRDVIDARRDDDGGFHRS